MTRHVARTAVAFIASAGVVIGLGACSGSGTAEPAVTVTVTQTALPAPTVTVAQRGNIYGGDDQLPLLGKPQAYTVGHTIERIQEYHNSGRWEADIQAIAATATKSINDWISKNCQIANGKVSGCNGVVVFDIDDTLVSFYPYYNEVQTDWKYNADTFREYWTTCQPPPIVPIRTLYQRLTRLEVPIILISGREANLAETTLKCLSADGYPRPTQMLLRRPNDTQPSYQLKATYRAQIQASGKTIVANIGDQSGDLSGGHQRAAFLVPNPMYRLE